jgi:hypothetical protein
MPISTPRTGRAVAALLLAQMVMAPIANFRLLAPAMSAPPGFLVNAAPHATQVYVALLLAIAGSACSLLVAVAVYPVLERRSRRWGPAFLALTAVGLAAVIGEGLMLRGMLALSLSVSQAGGAIAPDTEVLATLLRAMRSGAHFTSLLLGGCALGVFYAALFHLRLVPRTLSTLGLAAVVPLLVAAALPLVGRHTVMTLFMPVGLAQLALVAWLAAKGFAEQAVPAEVVT